MIGVQNARHRAAALALAVVLIASILTVGVSSRPAQASSPVTAVFHSGLGCAGLAQAGAAARRLRAKSGPCLPAVDGGTGYYNCRWTSNTACDASHATYPATLNGQAVTQLAGFGLGRLGPL